MTQTLTAGHRVVNGVPAIAALEGAWSMVLELDTLLTSRRWDAPYPEGLVAQAATRLLYGSGWTVMLGLETAIALAASGGHLDWVGDARYVSDWMIGTTTPTCPTPGTGAGCGAGVGGFVGVHVRPKRSAFWYEVSAGWLEQRVANDAERTLEESFWVLSPLTVTYGPHAAAGPIALDARIGPGAYFGMHSAHLHPTSEGVRAGVDVPWTELYPLDVGVGLGGRAELDLTVARRLCFEARYVLAPLVAGTRHPRMTPKLEPLAKAPDGILWWRAFSVGVTADNRHAPFRLGASLFFAELSTRPPNELGHAGFMLHFDYSLAASFSHKH